MSHPASYSYLHTLNAHTTRNLIFHSKRISMIEHESKSWISTKIIREPKLQVWVWLWLWLWSKNIDNERCLMLANQYRNIIRGRLWTWFTQYAIMDLTDSEFEKWLKFCTSFYWNHFREITGEKVKFSLAVLKCSFQSRKIGTHRCKNLPWFEQGLRWVLFCSSMKHK